MRSSLRVLVFAVAAIVGVAGCCGTSPPPRPRVGSTLEPSRWLLPLNTVTGNNATVIIFDTTNAGQNPGPSVDRIVISCYFDQAVTLQYQVRHRGSSTWRTVNGNGSGDTVSASTQTAIDFLILGYDSRVQVVTGGTGPSTAEVDIGLVYVRPLGM